MIARILQSLIVAAVLTLGSAATQAQGIPRLDVWIYRFSGVGDSERHRQAFEKFLYVVQDRLLTLSGELSGFGTEFSYLGNLRREVVRDASGTVEFQGNLNDLKSRWSYEGTLQVVIGRLEQVDPGAAFRVQSRIYVGELRGRLPGALVQLDLNVKLDEFEDAVDAHAVAAIYALAMDAAARGLRRDMVLRLLNEAQKYALDLDDKAGGTKLLKTAIAQSLGDYGAAPR